MNNLSLAFFIGLLGSVHCIGMCGPLMLCVPLRDSSVWTRWRSLMTYQAGRLLTYSCLGLFVGLIGENQAFPEWQQGLSLATGITLILLGLYQLSGLPRRRQSRLAERLLQPVLLRMSRWLYRPGGHFMVGILNGLLPCGMVYMALAAAMNNGGSFQGAAFMFAYGLGTLPLLLLALSAGTQLKRRFPFIQRFRLLPVLCLMLGFWFLLRGASLDIPYLSPALRATPDASYCR